MNVKTRTKPSAACWLLIFLITLGLCGAVPAQAANSFTWNTKSDKVSADIKDGDLMAVLGQIASDTGWQVFVEPDGGRKVSARFKDLAPGDALRILLGNLNFALVPATGGSKLYVFATSRENATQRVRPSPLPETEGLKLIGNELVLKLKPGANIDEIARALGAQVVGRLDKNGLYRLRFEDIDAANAARESLASNSDVESIENNYAINRPGGGRPVLSTTAVPPHLNIKLPPETGAIIVGLIDTAVQSLGPNLDKFVLEQIAVAGKSSLDPSVPSHGTSMLATLLASLAGETKGSSSVRVLPVDIYGGSATTSTFQVAEGIVEAIKNGANVINQSFGSEGDSQYVADLIKDATDKGILFLGAAGNTPVTTPYYPAADPNVLAVTATENGELAWYANRGDFVSIGAPGTSVVFFNGRPYYVVGTSAATAYTSGLAAGHREKTGATSQETSKYLRQAMPAPLPPK